MGEVKTESHGGNFRLMHAGQMAVNKRQKAEKVGVYCGPTRLEGSLCDMFCYGSDLFLGE